MSEPRARTERQPRAGRSVRQFVFQAIQPLTDRLVGRPVLRQVGGLTAGRTGAALVSFLWLALLARTLPLRAFADVALLVSVGTMFSVVADWGYALVLNEAVAVDLARGRATLIAVIRRRVLLSLAASAGTFAFYLAAANDRSLFIPAVFAVSIAATAWHSSCSAALRGAGWIGPEAVNEVVSRLLVLMIGATLVLNGGDVVAVALTYALVDLGSAVVLSGVCWRRLGVELPVDSRRLAWARVMPLGFAALAGTVYYRIDVWLLALMSQALEVAQYSVCVRVIDALMLPAGVVAMISIRATSSQDRIAAVASTDRLARRVCLMLAPAVLALELFPAQVLEVAFGAEYGKAEDVLRILALAVVPAAAGIVWSPLLALRGHGMLAISSGSMVLNVALNVIMIPSLGATGAAVATVLGQGAFASLVRFSLRSRAEVPCEYC